jgi:hypothetical protein
MQRQFQANKKILMGGELMRKRATKWEERLCYLKNNHNNTFTAVSAAQRVNGQLTGIFK